MWWKEFHIAASLSFQRGVKRQSISNLRRSSLEKYLLPCGRRKRWRLPREMENTRSNIGGHIADTSTAVRGSTIAQTVNPVKVKHSWKFKKDLYVKNRVAKKRTLMTMWTQCGPIYIQRLWEFSAMKKEILRWKYIGHKTNELGASFSRIHAKVELTELNTFKKFYLERDNIIYRHLKPHNCVYFNYFREYFAKPSTIVNRG